MNAKVVFGALALLLAVACSTRTAKLPDLREAYEQPTMDEVSANGDSTFSVLSGDGGFIGSAKADVGRTGLFPVRDGSECTIAVLASGEESFAQRMQALEAARKSIRIQALIYTGDEAGLRIREILKRKHREGLDVRIIVDAFSNPSLQTQNMGRLGT